MSSPIASNTSTTISARTTTTTNGGGPGTPKRGRQHTDLNHLLGFTLPPRAPPPSAHSGPRRSAKRSNNHGAYDRQRFVHHFRFVLNPGKDYRAHFVDPDIYFDWGDIVQVIVDKSAKGEIPACPVCLSVPTAARMSKCGHVYCYSCLLHYLSLGEAKFRKCPLCIDAIHEKDLKPVRWHDPIASTSSTPHSPVPLPIYSNSHSQWHSHSHSHSQSHIETSSSSALSTLEMRLIRRPQNTTIALPRQAYSPLLDEGTPAVLPSFGVWDFTPDALTYAKFLLGSPDYLKAELMENVRELEREIVTLSGWAKSGATDDELGVVYVRAALEKVKEQIVKVDDLNSTAVTKARELALKQLKNAEKAVGKLSERLAHLAVAEPVLSNSASETEEDTPAEYLGARSTGGATFNLSEKATPFSPPSQSNPDLASLSSKLKPPRRVNNNFTAPVIPTEDTYYFYQAASGAHIFLQPLDIKILTTHFGSHEALPDTLTVAVDGSDEGSMNEDLRKRCRWLAHLPTSVDLTFIETDLSAIVPSQTLEAFSAALKQRRMKRRDKGRREDKAKLKSEQKEAEDRPRFEMTTYREGSYQIPLTSSTLASSLYQDRSFPPPSSTSNPSMRAIPTPPDPHPLVTAAESNNRTVWGTTTSFSAALHSSARPSTNYEIEPEYEERWADFEEAYAGFDSFSGGGGAGGRGRNNGGRNNGGGASSGSNSGGGRNVQDIAPTGGGGRGKKKGKKLVLTAGGRGTA